MENRDSCRRRQHCMTNQTLARELRAHRLLLITRLNRGEGKAEQLMREIEACSEVLAGLAAPREWPSIVELNKRVSPVD